MRLGVVVPCYRQERDLARTLPALEAAMGHIEWRGALVIAAPGGELPPLSSHWTLIAPPVARPLTPGAARMLGFSACGGEWVLFVDADVEVDAAWLTRALTVAASRAGRDQPVGLGGRLEEWFEDGASRRRGNPDMYKVGTADRDVDYLATLAFYSREALTRAGGYDARLQSEEDFELGLRFRRLDLRLRSLGMLAGRHWSAPRPSFSELSRRWRTGLCFGQGQVLRLYVGRPGFAALLQRQSLYLLMLALWASGLACAIVSGVTRDARVFVCWCAALLALFALMTARKRSPRLALHSILTWTLNGAGLAVGLLRGPTIERSDSC